MDNKKQLFDYENILEDLSVEERRQLTRVEYTAPGVIVVCDTEEKVVVKVKDVSPLGMGVLMEKSGPDILGKDIIIVADCLVMYANVNRVDEFDEEHYIVGISGRKFTDDVLTYLFEHIG